ncbi:MAG TPA: MBL fold metallo-hydrolase [Nitrososphaerales archaeon]|nr:MBL fold metallo-hydrolase [Nitrososphaerales archaeon]
MTEIVKGVQYVDGSNANSYLVEESDGTLTLIDAGMQADGKRILGFITSKLNRKPSEVKTIVITHCHFDHTRGLAAIKAATGGKVAVHEADADFVSGKKRYPPPRGAMGIAFSVMSPFFKTTPVESDLILREGDRVGRLAVFHTPGHTPGSISLYDNQDRVLFVGDTARYVKGRLEGPPPRFTQRMDQAKTSIERLSSLDFEVMLSGHGEPLRSSDAPRKMHELSNEL